jgi:hypothetical protein
MTLRGASTMPRLTPQKIFAGYFGRYLFLLDFARGRLAVHARRMLSSSAWICAVRVN